MCAEQNKMGFYFWELKKLEDNSFVLRGLELRGPIGF